MSTGLLRVLFVIGLFAAPVASGQKLAAGSFRTCAVLSSGALRCWGYGSDGALGYGNTNTIGDDETPASAGDVPVGNPVRAIVSGISHVCAVLVNGQLRCWGANNFGQLGTGSTTQIGDDELASSAPVVPIGGSVMDVAAGAYHTCALLTEGQVRCWGQSLQSQLGFPGASARVAYGDDPGELPTPDVTLGGPAVQIVAGETHTCALMQTGSVKCWGGNSLGQLGYGDTRARGNAPSDMPPPDVDLGGRAVFLSAHFQHTCAVLDTGGMRCWGQGSFGQLGYGQMQDVGDDETPASMGDVPVGGSVRRVATGAYHTCAVLTTGAVRCWGRNDSGQLGIGSTARLGDEPGEMPTPAVALGAIAVTVAAGSEHSCALTSTGGVRCWGGGTYGQHGYATRTRFGDEPGELPRPDVDLGGRVSVGIATSQRALNTARPRLHVVRTGVHTATARAKAEGSATAQLELYDVLGRRIGTWVQPLDADGRGTWAITLPAAGVYVLRLTTASSTATASTVGL